MQLPHHERAESLARAMFTDDSTPVARPSLSRLSVTVPTGVLACIDGVAKQLTAGNRSQAAAHLLELGYGLLMEHLTPDQREFMQAVVMEQLPVPADLVEGED